MTVVKQETNKSKSRVDFHRLGLCYFNKETKKKKSHNEMPANARLYTFLQDLVKVGNVVGKSGVHIQGCISTAIA